MTDEERREVVEAALQVVRSAATHRDKMAGARVLIAADAQNTRRERTATLAEHHDRQDATAALRALLANPAIRDRIADLSCELASTGQDASVQASPHVGEAEGGEGFNPPSEISRNLESPANLATSSNSLTLPPPSDDRFAITTPPGHPETPPETQVSSLLATAIQEAVEETPPMDPLVAEDESGQTQWASWPPPGCELKRGKRGRRKKR